MKNEIVINLQSKDRVENLLPYMEKTVEPGTRVVFVIPYPANGLIGADQNQPATR